MIWVLISLTCCAIVTTGIVYDLIVFPLLCDEDREDHAYRTIRAFTFFALLEMVSSIISLEKRWTILPFIILCFAWCVSGIALYNHYKLVKDGSIMAREETMKRANIVRGILWLGRFICLFVLVCININ